MPALTLHRGPRAVERALFARLDELAAEAEREPSLLASPVWVVVASGAQAEHLAAAWVRHRGRAAAGVRFATLFAVAREVLAGAGEAVVGGGLAFELLARRAAATEPRLGPELGELADGFAAVVGSVRDLADAGFSAAHLEAFEERLQALPARGLAAAAQVERARQLAAVAIRCRRELDALGLLTPGGVYARAAEHLLGDAGLLPSRAVWVAGFANATGVALDFLETLVSRKEAEVLLDLPGDPAAPGGPGEPAEPAGIGFVTRLALRLGGLDEAALRRLAATAEATPETVTPRLTWRKAPGLAAEVRAAVLEVSARLEAGAVAERLAIVARDLGPYRLALRADLAAFGVPFSGRGPGGSPGAVERRLAALIELLRQGPRLAAERWLAAGHLLPGEGERLDLRLGLASLGVARLDHVARLDAGSALVSGALPLPVPAGEEEADEEEPETEPSSPPHRRRRLAGAHLYAAVRSAADLTRHLEARPRRAPLGEHLVWLRQLTAELLAWPAGDPAAARLAAVAGRLADELPARLTLSPDELTLALERALDEAAELPLGGAGGGVAVLSATEARSLSFDFLVLLGANRDLFPRKVVEDPLLPDPLRRALLEVLPDLPVKGEGHEEERHLFAQLLAAAPELRLSWATASDDGEPRSASPLLERLRLALERLGEAPSVEQAPHLLDPFAGAEVPLPAGLEALRRGLSAGRDGWLSALPAALQAAGETESLATVKRRLLDELDPDLSTPEGRAAASRLGPCFGLVGALEVGSSDGGADLYVTELEDLARCSWRRTLERTMGLEPTPDPLATFATLEGVMVGEVVHAVLARWVEAGGGAVEAPLAEALAASPVPLSWPAPRELSSWLEPAARKVARERGAPLLAQALAARARVLLGLVERELFTELQGPLSVVGAELAGAVPLAAAPGGRLLFRVDLVEAQGPESRLTDLKVGRPLSDLKKPESRLAKLLRAVGAGERLQAAAYALALSSGGRGRYLFVGAPEAEFPARTFELSGDDATRAAFERATGPLVAARAAGAFLPRLLDPHLEREGPACRGCRVHTACSQRDTGAVRRLARWVEGRRAGAAAQAGASPTQPATLSERALAVFELASPPEGER